MIPPGIHPSFVDMQGRRVGKLTVDRRAANLNGNARWVCKCDCGATCVVEGIRLRHALKDAEKTGIPCSYGCSSCSQRTLRGGVTNVVSADPAMGPIPEYEARRAERRRTHNTGGRQSQLNELRRLINKHEGDGRRTRAEMYWHGFDDAIRLLELALDVRVKEDL